MKITDQPAAHLLLDWLRLEAFEEIDDLKMQPNLLERTQNINARMAHQLPISFVIEWSLTHGVGSMSGFAFHCDVMPPFAGHFGTGFGIIGGSFPLILSSCVRFLLPSSGSLDVSSVTDFTGVGTSALGAGLSPTTSVRWLKGLMSARSEERRVGKECPV